MLKKNKIWNKLKWNSKTTFNPKKGRENSITRYIETKWKQISIFVKCLTKIWNFKIITFIINGLNTPLKGKDCKNK